VVVDDVVVVIVIDVSVVAVVVGVRVVFDFILDVTDLHAEAGVGAVICYCYLLVFNEF
jgi:hypothetical protein